jgi:hypothetical protein
MHDTECGGISYSLLDRDDDDNVASLDFISLSGTTLTVYSTKMSEIGDYHLTFRAKMSSWSGQTDVDFTVTIVDPCLTDTIVPSSISTVSVSITDLANTTFNFANFTEQYNAAHENCCGFFNYSSWDYTNITSFNETN